VYTKGKKNSYGFSQPITAHCNPHFANATLRLQRVVPSAKDCLKAKLAWRRKKGKIEGAVKNRAALYRSLFW